MEKKNYGDILNSTIMDSTDTCTISYSHLGDSVLITSLHDVMSTRVDNSSLPESRL